MIITIKKLIIVEIFFDNTINKIISNYKIYLTEIGEGFYNPNFIQFYNEEDDSKFNIMVIKDTLCSFKYFVDCYCYFLFYKEKEGKNNYYLGTSKDINVYNDLIYLHDLALNNNY